MQGFIEKFFLGGGGNFVDTCYKKYSHHQLGFWTPVTPQSGPGENLLETRNNRVICSASANSRVFLLIAEYK